MAINLNPWESTSALGTPADGMSSNATEFASTSRGNPARVSVMVPSNEFSSNSLDDSSPDALKNTPSNIARLEDIIEHSEARRKYLAQTKSPSDGEDVRWYFCKVPLAPHELAASVPVTEMEGKSDYFRFSMRDSLALEASFLQEAGIDLRPLMSYLIPASEVMEHDDLWEPKSLLKEIQFKLNEEKEAQIRASLIDST